MDHKKRISAAFVCVITAAVSIIASIALLFFTDSPKLVKSPSEVFISGFHVLVDTPSGLQMVTSQLSLDDEKIDLIASHYKMMFTDEMIDYYSKRLETQGILKKGCSPEELLSAVFRMRSELSMQGLLRVSAKDRAAYFNYAKKQIELLSPKACKLFVTGDKALYSDNEIENSYEKVFQNMTYEELDDYLCAMRNSAYAQLKGTPSKIILSEDEKHQAQESFSSQMSKLFYGMNDKTRDDIADATDNIKEGKGKDLCEYQKTVYKAAFGIEDENLRDYVFLMLLRENR